MDVTEFPETPGFGPPDWLHAFDPAVAEFYRPAAGGGLRTVAPPFAAAQVAEVVALARVTPSRFAASAVLVNGEHAVLSARCDHTPHLRWTSGPDAELVLLVGLDWTERSRLLLQVTTPEMAARLAGVTRNHPSARGQRRRRGVPRSALAQLALARDLLVELAPLMWLTDEGDLMVAETPVPVSPEAVDWLRQFVPIDEG